MQYAAVILALAATAMAGKNATVTSYTTEIVDTYTTYCPEATTLTYGTYTYTATASETLTITECPCTITKPVVTSSVVAATSAPVYANSSTPAATTPATKATSTPVSVGTTSAHVSTTPTTVPASSGNKVFAMSGASLAGLLAVAAYIL